MYNIIDDILVFSRTLHEHIHPLSLVVNRLVEVNLKLKPTKCKFLRQEVEYLGYTITPQGLKTSDRHVLAVQDLPTPKSVTDVRSFLGMASY